MNRLKTTLAFIVGCTVAALQIPSAAFAQKVIHIETDNPASYKAAIVRQEPIRLADDKGVAILGIDQVQLCGDGFLVRDNRDLLYLFDKNGHMLSSSAKAFGKGNGQYGICLAYSYNKRSGNIEVVVPDGIIFYDRDFKFVRKASFNNPGVDTLMFNRISDIDSHTHLLFSPLESENETANYYVFDSKDNKLLAAREYPRLCRYITMQTQCLSGDSFMAFPCMNYTFYTFNAKSYACKPLVTFDFGAKALTKGETEGERDSVERRLLDSDKAMPLRTFKSGDTIISVVKEGTSRSSLKTVIVDCKSWRTTTVTGLPVPDAFADGTLYSNAYDKATNSYYIIKTHLK